MTQATDPERGLTVVAFPASTSTANDDPSSKSGLGLQHRTSNVSSTSSVRSNTGLRNSRYPKVELKRILLDQTKRPVTLSEFRRFMVDVEHGSESLDFWVEAERLKTDYAKHAEAMNHVKNDTVFADMERRRNAIVKDYIEAGSPNELNITSKQRAEILDAIKSSPDSVNPEVFLNVQKHCYDLISANSLPRFLRHTMTNIGKEEIASRRRQVVIMALLTLMIILLSLLYHPFKRGLRFLVIIPSFVMFACLYQQHIQFCMVYGFLGKVRRVGVALFGLLKEGTLGGTTEIVEESCVRQSHRALAFQVMGIALVCSVILGVVLWAIPVNI
ncbi:hypothetical protein HKX48_009285 [Thoreauomyces humboldtii]|nr:hypothetical protein HKX48_009285 [Thoreauomyces humboldtii]